MTTLIADEIALLDQEVVDEQTGEIEKMASLEHGAIGALLGGYLSQDVYPNKLGLVCDAQTAFTLVGKPPTRQPDVAFIARARLPKNITLQGRRCPDLAIEVVSENDKISETEAKVWQYQEFAGAVDMGNSPFQSDSSCL